MVSRLTPADADAAGSPVVMALLKSTFRHFTLASPVVLQSPGAPRFADVGGEGGFLFGDITLQLQGTGREAAETVAGQLARGPVFLIPSWDRLDDAGDRRSNLRAPRAFEEVLAQCVPISSESLLGVLVPALFLKDQRSRRTREQVANHWEMLSVIYFDNRSTLLPAVHASFDLAALFLGGQAYVKSPLRIFQVPTVAEPTDVTADFESLLKRRGGRTRFGYALWDGVSPGEDLTFERHDPAISERRADLASYGQVVPLGTLFDVVGPGVSPTENAADFCEAGTPGAVRIITGRSLQRDGLIDAGDDDARWALTTRNLLKPGDILVREIRRRTDVGGLVVSPVRADDLPATTSKGVIALRPVGQQKPEGLLFTLLYLRSSVACELLQATGLNGDIRVTRSALMQLDLPQPDLALTETLAGLAETSERMRSWQFDASALLNSVFLDQSAAQSRVRLLQSGRTLRLRAEAASLLDDFSYVVRTRFPHPIAYRWRAMEASVSGGSSQDAYRSVLDAAETALCYAAHLAFALARSANCTLAQLGELRKKLAGSRVGGGMGDWIAVLREVSQAKAFRRLPPDHPLCEFRFLSTEEADQAVSRLFSRRNDISHQRSIDIPELPEAIDDAKQDLTTLLRSMEFLCDLTLLDITSARWDSLLGKSFLSCRELMGDHPIVAARSRMYSQGSIEDGSLYLSDMQGRLHLLRPFLAGKICAKCGNWSTFHVDGVTGGGRCKTKCLERGHVIFEPDLSEALNAVGLL